MKFRIGRKRFDTEKMEELYEGRKKIGMGEDLIGVYGRKRTKDVIAVFDSVWARSDGSGPVGIYAELVTPPQWEWLKATVPYMVVPGWVEEVMKKRRK